jgi:apolipoprotein N-acyltransferase
VAASRLRAIEAGRAEAQIAPTGFTAFVSADGQVLDRSGVSERTVLTRDVPLRSGRTLWLRFGPWPPFLLALALMAAAALGARRDSDHDGTQPPPIDPSASDA